MIKLIISDMDGTFLNSDNAFNQEYFKKYNRKCVKKELFLMHALENNVNE